MKNTTNLEHFDIPFQFCAKAIGNSLLLALIVLLIAAWLVSDPLLRLFDAITRMTKQGINKQNRRDGTVTNGMGRSVRLGLISSTSITWLMTAESQINAQPTDSTTHTVQSVELSSTNIWVNGVGNGFRSGAQSASLSLGAGYGVQILGSRQSHDLALAGISYGYMLGSVMGEGHWYRGNLELRGELISGGQFAPSSDWLVGITPHLRYNFATGTRWIPYVDVGAGLSATSIGPPDLSNCFEFNLQAATGVRWFIRDNVALGIEARYLHMSDAGISKPNLGLNNVNGMLSISWFF